MEDNYKLYVHVFPNDKRYIGITVRKPKYRWANGKGYSWNIDMTNDINKYGWDNIEHKILFKGLTKEEAELKEKEYIAKYNTTNKEYGYNILIGGNLISDEGRLYMSEQRTGEGNPMYGLYGKKHPKAIKINQYGMDGIFIKTWDCSADAKRSLDIAKTDIIRNCKGKSKSAGGYQWKYYKGNTENVKPYKKKSVHGKDNPMHGRTGKNNKKSKPVEQYTLDGEYIRTWISATEVQNETGMSLKCITACCRGETKTSYKYIWKFA